MADQASLFRGRLPISGYKVSADWLEPTVYPLLGFPRTPFLTVAENLLLYRQSQEACLLTRLLCSYISCISGHFTVQADGKMSRTGENFPPLLL